jgi:hypothetical protein
VLIFHEGVKLKCVRVVDILVRLVEPVVDVGVGFRLRLGNQGKECMLQDPG